MLKPIVFSVVILLLLQITFADPPSTGQTNKTKYYSKYDYSVPENQRGNLTINNFVDYFRNYALRDTIEGHTGYWAPTLIAFAIGIFLTALAWMLSEILVSPQLKAWVKSELYELGVSALLIVLVIALLGVFSAASRTIAGSDDFYKPAETYLKHMQSKGVDYYIKLNSYEFIIGFFTTMHTSVFLPARPPFRISVSLGPGVGLTPVSEGNILITDFTGVAVAANSVQLRLLTFFQKTMLSVFLPLGIFLRTFFLTRRVGSSIIAFAITGYFMFPVSVIMVQEMERTVNFREYENYQNVISFASATPEAAETGLNEFVGGAQAANEALGEVRGRAVNTHVLEPSWCEQEDLGIILGGLCKVYSAVRAVVLAAEGAIEAGAMAFAFMFHNFKNALLFWHLPVPVFYETISYADKMAGYLVFVFMGMVVEIVVSVTAYRSLAASIGGEVEIFGLSKLV